MKEKTFYKYVEKFLKNEYGCFSTEQKIGTTDVGFSDVVGIRDVGGQFSGDIEIISVEVKLYANNFGKLVGQALGYSVFANKVYLAVPMGAYEGFTAEQKEIANRLGVGLIEINMKTKKCKEVLSSSYHSPIIGITYQVINKMLYGKCCICGSITFGTAKGSLKTALKKDADLELNTIVKDEDGKERKLLFTRSKTQKKVSFVCKDCIKALELGD